MTVPLHEEEKPNRSKAMENSNLSKISPGSVARKEISTTPEEMAEENPGHFRRAWTPGVCVCANHRVPMETISCN